MRLSEMMRLAILALAALLAVVGCAAQPSHPQPRPIPVRPTPAQPYSQATCRPLGGAPVSQPVSTSPVKRIIPGGPRHDLRRCLS